MKPEMYVTFDSFDLNQACICVTRPGPRAGFLIGIVGGGVQLCPLGTAATNRPIVPPPGDYDDGEIGGIIGRRNRSTRRKPAPVSLCPPQTPHAARTRTRAASVGSQRLTAWATARPRAGLGRGPRAMLGSVQSGTSVSMHVFMAWCLSIVHLFSLRLMPLFCERCKIPCSFFFRCLLEHLF
jgi:hypothetical protein